MRKTIYLDNNSTTAVDPRVIATVAEKLQSCYGNPSSIHSYGQQARAELSSARSNVAEYLGITPQELIFTSGGTEGANMLLRGLFPYGSRGHIITSSVEHSSVYATVKSLEDQGVRASFLDPGPWGAIRAESIESALQSDTKLIALMAVNNETGVKTDIEAVAAVAAFRKIPLFVDGVALLGKEHFFLPDGVSAICFSGHKLHAPKGIGCLAVRRHLKLFPLMSGGDQERGMRPGTENVIGAVALAAAITLLRDELPAATKRMAQLRDRFEGTLQAELSGVEVNGLGPRVANTSNLAFEDVEGELLLTALDLADEGVLASHGSACASGALQPSRVLLNMGFSRERAAASLRFSLCRYTTGEEIDLAVEAIVRAVKRLRG